jgi:glucose/arabinose dehydrogenase
MRRLRVAAFGLVVAVAVLAFACGSDDEPGTPDSGIDVTPAEAAPTATPEPAPPEPPPPLSDVRVERVFPGLSFTQPTGMYQAPDGRFFVLEQPGRIMVFESRPDAEQASVWLDIRGRVNSQGNEEGLLGLAFAPDFERSGHVFINYTALNPRRTVIARYTAPDPRGGAADPDSELVILEVQQPFPNHNGGQTIFGPDGFLYIGFGDGGSARDPMGHGQNPGTLLGTLVRIDVSGGESGRNYRIPPDNPFVGQPGARPEVFAYGIRNPWRFSFDPETNEIWLADVGQNAREEINIVEPGGNYGWDIMEGTICTPPAQTCDMSGLIPPIHEYPTGSDCSITGGYLYRGDVYPSLRAAYVFGDFCSGRVWALRYDGQQVTEHREIVRSGAQITSFAMDHDGNIYIVDRRGPIHRLANP